MFCLRLAQQQGSYREDRSSRSKGFFWTSSLLLKELLGKPGSVSCRFIQSHVQPEMPLGPEVSREGRKRFSYSTPSACGWPAPLLIKVDKTSSGALGRVQRDWKRRSAQ